MDHVIEYISTHMEFEVSCFAKEWESGKYKKITDCPTYSAIKAYCDAINVLSKYLYGETKYNTPEDILKARLDIY